MCESSFVEQFTVPRVCGLSLALHSLLCVSLSCPAKSSVLCFLILLWQIDGCYQSHKLTRVSEKGMAEMSGLPNLHGSVRRLEKRVRLGVQFDVCVLG